MSFGDLETGKRPKQWCGEDSAFEQEIRANVREMQESIRYASQQLEHSYKACISKRASDSLDKSLGKSAGLVQETEQLFRDWTVHLAGEPAVRHKKKLSYEKLQKAFREEVDRLKEVSRRAEIIRQEALCAEGCLSSSISMECHGMCDEQGSSWSDEEHCLLPSDADRVTAVCDDVLIQNRIALERQEGIKRISSQVTQVNQMFRDLASIVNEQDSHFQTIEQQAESASCNTLATTTELKKTADRQRSHFERICCMLVLAMLVLCFVLVSNMPHMHTGHSVGSK